MIVEIDFSYDMFRHPASTKSGTKISDETCSKLLATTLCRMTAPGVIDAHAVTLYKVNRGEYIFKNTWPGQPEIKIPITRQMWPTRDGLPLTFVFIFY